MNLCSGLQSGAKRAADEAKPAAEAAGQKLQEGADVASDKAQQGAEQASDKAQVTGIPVVEQADLHMRCKVSRTIVCCNSCQTLRLPLVSRYVVR